MNKKNAYLRFIFIVLLASFGVCAQSEIVETSMLQEQKALPIDARITELLKQSERDPEQARVLVTNIEETSATFNAAEHFLLLMIKANVEVEPNREQKVIAWLLDAKQYEETIPEDQRHDLRFITLYLTLSKNYAALKQFKNAYEEEKIYIKKYRAYLALQKKNKIASLDEIYETSRKNKENELLKSQNELKQLQLQDVEKTKFDQHRNIILIVITAIIFILLLYRQLKLRKSLKHIARTDSLTGLFNRRTLFKYGSKSTIRALRNHEQLSVALIDIDNFKSINDNYGHQVGDEVIKVVATLGSETMRSRDIFARLGGEEFVAVLPEASLGEAKAISERLREKVANFSLNHLGIEYRLSVSIGVANLRQISGEFDELLNAADHAMYQAKAHGKNQVISYQEAITETPQ